MLTWNCDICDRERPDDKISVYKRDVGQEHGLPDGVMQQNIKYCNDNIECGRAADNYDHFKNSKKKKVVHLDIDDVLSHEDHKKKVTMKDYVTWFFIFFAVASLVNTTLSVLLTDATFSDKLFDSKSIIIRIIIAAWLSVVFTKRIEKKV